MNEGPQTLTLPLLPTRSFVLFPSNIQPIEAGRSFSINAIRAAHAQADSLLFVACQKNPNDETVSFDSVYQYGTLCRIVSIIEKGDLVRVRVDVVERVRLNNLSFDKEDKLKEYQRSLILKTNQSSERLLRNSTTYQMFYLF